jgi:hypothetical protein
MDDFNGQFEGPYSVEFTNGKRIVVDVERNINDQHGHPIYLIGKDGKIYHWRKIISIKRRY